MAVGAAGVGAAYFHGVRGIVGCLDPLWEGAQLLARLDGLPWWPVTALVGGVGSAAALCFLSKTSWIN